MFSFTDDRRAFLKRQWSVWGCLWGLDAVVGRLAVGADEPAIRAEIKQAIERGLGYLARAQNEDGSFGVGPMSRNVEIGRAHV